MQLISKAKIWAKSLKRDIVVLWLAARDARVPHAQRQNLRKPFPVVAGACGEVVERRP